MHTLLSFAIFCTLSFYLTGCSTTNSYSEKGKTYHPAPVIAFSDLKTDNLPGWRKDLIKEALKVRSESHWPRYVFGSADPSRGGFDCSGVFHYTFKRINYSDVPRTSSDQYLWLKEKGTIYYVSKSARTLNHSDFKNLIPGDLVFWSGTYQPTDGRTTSVTHVGMYLGYQKGYPRPIMICASKGRYYDGLRRDGFGIYDFKVPSATSRSQIIAYGGLQQTSRFLPHLF